MPCPRALGAALILSSSLLPLGAAAELPQRVEQIARALKVGTDEISVWVQAVDAETPMLVHLPDVARTPASTLKLVTTFAALQGLTPAYRWRTEAWALGPVENRVLKGDLLLRGAGDPYLVEEEYWKLVGGIHDAGIDRIEGDLVLDTSYFEVPEEDLAAFDGEPDRVYNLTPHPLLVNFNAARFEFAPARDGRHVDVFVDPPLAELEVDNRLSLAEQGCYGYQRGVALNVVDGVAKRDRVMLEGRFPKGCDLYAMTRTVLRPESYAFGLFDVYWRQFGGDLGGRWRLGTLPEGLIPEDEETGIALPAESDALLHVHESPPLGDVVRLINKYSNNVMTRHLHLTLGAERFGVPATAAKGDEAILELLARSGVDTEGLVIDNASGLTREARITARQLGQLLLAGWNAPYMPEFVSSLSLVGLDGTASGRLRGRRAVGRMHVKTGTLDEVSAIAGYVQARSGERYVVAVLVNGPLADRGPGREIQDALLYWVYDRDG
ncbi:MAG: D-alanyl-D-alanine carboxypeptidase/D-alanyl-D-alanine-endopeptidase [Pseudomonadales bacterium]|jgi:D-alanyl-D-alanine carboxypeptidase/D-alanyl-D-alanine-endopeptidase (penicillin-binding protein 4)|nr:D-alanyl-D-alanine carboxypeptidase/D-alanyl-D-alanine-endopeptidase [Pseudomonadales bacterium]